MNAYCSPAAPSAGFPGNPGNPVGGATGLQFATSLHDSCGFVQFEGGGFGEGFGTIGGDDEGVFDADVELFFRHPQLGIEGPNSQTYWRPNSSTRMS